MIEPSNTIHTARTYIIYGVVGCLLLAGIVAAVIFFVDRDFDAGMDNTPAEAPSDEAVDEISNVPDPMPNDLDRDGIENAKEEEMGLSTANPDTDADGLQDNDEITVWKSDPLKFDTDGDGYGDGWEVLKGYSPVGPGTIESTQE